MSKSTQLPAKTADFVRQQWAIWRPLVGTVVSGPELTTQIEDTWDTVPTLHKFNAPWLDIVLGDYANSLSMLLDLAEAEYGQPGVIATGFHAWSSLLYPGLLPHLTRDGMYAECVEVLTKRLGLNEDPHAYPTLTKKLTNPRIGRPLDVITECRAASSIWKVAPALFPALHSNHDSSVFNNISSMVEDNMRLAGITQERPSVVRQDLRRSKGAIRDYVEAAVVHYPLNEYNARLVLNIMGWLDRYKVRPPKIGPQVCDTLIGFSPQQLMRPDGSHSDQVARAVVRLRHEVLSEMTQSEERPSKMKLPKF